MEKRVVLTVALEAETGQFNILFGNGIKLPEDGKAGDIVEVQMGGGMSLPILLTMFLTSFKTMKERVMENPELTDEDRINMEQEIYDMLNIGVGSFLDQVFPLVNSKACLTEEACVEYGLDPKTATAEELLEAENKFIVEHADRASQTSEMQLEKPKQYDGKVGGPNREQRRLYAKKNKS